MNQIMKPAIMLLVTAMLGLSSSFCLGGEPVLFFSDLTMAPKIGWENSTQKGAAVTIWGQNFGSQRGNNYVTCNGTKLSSESDYAEWGIVDHARKIERITFWLNQACSDGDGEITVSVNGKTSNPLPFTIAPAAIYFISVNDGNNSYNGKYATYQGGSDGPWKDIKVFNPANHPDHESMSYVVYVRGGTYTTQDQNSCLCYIYGPSGTATVRKAIIGYPAELPVLDLAAASRGAFRNAKGSEGGPTNYYTISKLKFINGTSPIDLWGEYNSFIGNYFAENTQKVWSGVIMLNNAQHTKIYGNYFYHDGYDSYKHIIYIKTHRSPAGLGNGQCEYNEIAWNEFDSWTADLNPEDQPSRGGAIFISTESYAVKDGKRTNHIYIANNYFHDGDSEPIFTGDGCGDEIYIYNNIFANIAPETDRGLRFGGSAPSTIYLYNNTFYYLGKRSDPMLMITGTDTRVISRNNIYFAQAGQTFLKMEAFQGAKFESEFDCYYDADGSVAVPSGTSISVGSPLTKEPLFKAPNDENFYPTTQSPTNDSGTDAVSKIVVADYEGQHRPWKAAFDIGAYEYQEGTPTRITNVDTTPPAAATLLKNYPNPFNQSTIISFEVMVATKLTLAIYDSIGRLVVKLVDAQQAPGRKEIRWDGRDRAGRPLPSGVYFVTLAADNGATTQKILLIR